MKCDFKSLTDMLVLCHAERIVGRPLPCRVQVVELKEAEDLELHHKVSLMVSHTCALRNSWELNPAMHL